MSHLHSLQNKSQQQEEYFDIPSSIQTENTKQILQSVFKKDLSVYSPSKKKKVEQMRESIERSAGHSEAGSPRMTGGLSSMGGPGTAQSE